ncbi:50S ribosomal protein L25 [Romboutsia maritimum]|uniref:50S ribosomal protein L25 n=1 Tax=Romboutsia maritimum TaxID=2020948 RepID=A0A371IV09_9FIRM|nr:50S ribosomal protein L25 [Romboutsia maritimum]RDY24314.1 50S ribosomal protein L25 [Romboutsia maritimum]
MSNVVFKVYDRNTKENLKKMRKSGQVPCIIYGEFLPESIPAKMQRSELIKMLNSNYSGSIITLNLNDKNFNCVIKEVQKNNDNEIIHIDLQYVKANEVIKMSIPVRYFGQENLELQRLVLETFNPFIDLQGDVEEIPEYFEFDVSNMKFNDKLLVKDMDIPESVTLLSNPDTILAVVNG